MSGLLPLFPLQLVVFPGSAVPLHIFEDRYREMVGEAAAAGTEFGIVLAKKGGIAGGGCTVTVESVLKRYPDGRFDVMTRGRRRFRISSVDERRAYLRGEVEYFEDDDATPVSAELRAKVLQAFHVAMETIPGNPYLSFELAHEVQDLDFQNALQNTRSEVKRLRQLLARRADPMNGAGH